MSLRKNSEPAFRGTSLRVGKGENRQARVKIISRAHKTGILGSGVAGKLPELISGNLASNFLLGARIEDFA